VLDDGRLTDGHGRTVDFRNAVVIMTSNLGSHLFREHEKTAEVRPLVMETLLYSNSLRRGADRIRKKELYWWPADRPGAADSARYLDALALLVREAGRLVSKDRFLEDVWNGVPVTDEALTQCIKTLRGKLGDDASNPRFIETVPKHGYRFIAPVIPVEDSAARQAPGAGVSDERWRNFLATGIAGTTGGMAWALREQGRAEASSRAEAEQKRIAQASAQTAIDEAARMLVSAERPLLVAGDAVAHLEHRADLGDVVCAEVRRLDLMQQDVLELTGTEGSISGHEFGCPG